MINDCLFVSNNFNAEKELGRVCGEISSVSTDNLQITDKLTGSVCANGEKISFKDNGISGKIKWTWHTRKSGNDTFIIASVKNISDSTVVISDLAFSAELAEFTGNFASPLFFAWNNWDMSVKQIENGNYYSDNILHISAENGKTFFAGFITMSRARVWHELKAENGSYSWNAKMNIGKIHLKSGEIFNSEILLVSGYNNPYIALEDWSQKIYDIYKPEVNTKPTVCYSVGNMRPDSETFENAVLENLDAINEKMNGLGIEYVWTSQSNLKDFIPGNWLLDNIKEIPSGLAEFTKKIADKGYRHGVWMSPFWFFKEAEGAFEQHKNHLVKDKNGEPIVNEMAWCWKYEEDDKPNYHYHKCTLDGTHPDTVEYVKNIFSTYRDMGVRYYMLDFLDIQDNADYYDKSLTPVQSGYNILKTVREVAGNDTHLQTAVASSPGFTGIINAARIGRDFGEGRPIDRDELNDFKNATHVLHDMHYSNLKYFLINSACNYFTHQKTYMNDMNVLMIDSFPTEYSRFAITLFGLNGSTPLVLAGDIRNMRDDKINMMKLVLPRTQYSSKPVDLFERVAPDDYSRIQKLTVKTDWDEYTLVGVFNPDQTPYSLNLDFSKLGLDGEQIIYEFWNEEYRGVFRDSFPVTLLPESCKLFRFTKKRNHPWLIGTNMHIQQGVAEIKTLNWDEETMTLSGVATRPAGEKGNVIISAPKNLKPLSRGKCHIIKELLDHRLIIDVPLEFKTNEAAFELKFENWDFEHFTPQGLMPYSTTPELKAYMAENYKRESTRVFE